ncbi:cupin domain-containing protein [Natronorubrum sp. FCH18a]|uniref:cupin domain-containing protein n=1 Tax=Natronorubrum sp. FCH18a TaxID=3447018 RepID=UPI003F517C90
MGYHVVDPNSIDPIPDRPSEARSVSGEVGLKNLGMKLYTVAPGEDIPIGGLHYHDEQEEVFYVVNGEIRVETPDREYVVERNQFFVAEPESPHRAFNDDRRNEVALVLAVGAPSVQDGHVVNETQ